MASNLQIFIVLMVSWIAMFSLGWQARDVFGRPKIRRFKIKRRRPLKDMYARFKPNLVNR